MVVSVVMYDQRLYAPGHTIKRWADRMGHHVAATTAAAAPMNKRANKSRSAIAKDGPPGYLKSSINEVVFRIGPRAIDILVGSSASYAAYVALGTGEIVAEDMFLPFNPGFGTTKQNSRRVSKDRFGNFKDAVQGQRPQNFFEAGLDAASVRYSSLRR